MTREKYQFELPEGWRVYKNEFYKIDPSEDLPYDDKFYFIYYGEDMLLIENDHFHLDLGWQGGENGQYTIHFFKGNWLVGELLEKFRSKKSALIAERIVEILTAFKDGQFDNLRGYVVDDNDLSNQAVFEDLDSFEPRKG